MSHFCGQGCPSLLSFALGVEFPTGDSGRLRQEHDEVEVPGAPPSGVHGNDLALGSGSFDAIVGGAANARWRRLFFSADVQYFIRTRGDFGYRFGNEVSVSGGPGVSSRSRGHQRPPYRENCASDRYDTEGWNSCGRAELLKRGSRVQKINVRTNDEEKESVCQKPKAQ